MTYASGKATESGPRAVCCRVRAARQAAVALLCVVIALVCATDAVTPASLEFSVVPVKNGSGNYLGPGQMPEPRTRDRKDAQPAQQKSWEELWFCF